jgi:ferric-dicitrate binding protein FerR (iron transport regulator)
LEIDGQDATAMTSTNIAEYLSKNSQNPERVIVVSRAQTAALASTTAPAAPNVMASSKSNAAAPSSSGAKAGAIVGGAAAAGVLVAAANRSSMTKEQFKDYRTIMAPPGKLGIVIDKTPGGPIVKRVNDTSALYGKLLVGDKGSYLPK